MAYCPIDDIECAEENCNLKGKCNDRLPEKPVQSDSNDLLSDKVKWLKNRAAIAERFAAQKRMAGLFVEASFWEGRAYGYKSAIRKLNSP